MTTHKSTPIEQQIVRQLEAEREVLQPNIQMQLDRARRHALNDEPARQSKLKPWPWLATAGVASLATVMMIQLVPSPMQQPPASLDLDLLTMTEFDLFDQEPDFMVWLAEQSIEASADAAAASNGESG